MARTLSYIFVAAAVVGFANAANDWAKPCFKGDCSYDTDKSTLKVWGSEDAISDITEAGGWSILNCKPDALVQDIRLVCHDSAACNHLYRRIGAVGKLVRLPESCGTNAFAHVKRIWTHVNQEIPESVAQIIRKEGRAIPKVIGLALDTDFAAMDPAQSGVIHFSVSAVPSASVTPARRSDGDHTLVERWIDFNETLSTTLPPIDLSRTFPLFDKSLSCPATGNFPAFSASVHAEATLSAHAVVSVGVIAAGQLVPPKLEEFALFAGLDAQLDGIVRVIASATGTFDTGKRVLYSVALAGIDIPGIISVGPVFKIEGSVVAGVDIGVNVEAGLSYKIEKAQLVFPPTPRRNSSGGFTQTKTPLKLSVTPSLRSTARAEGHIVPALEFGISALAGIASAMIRLDVDANAVLTLNLEASAVITPPGTPTGQVKGCADLDTGLAVGAGANADFFGLFNPSTRVTLFQKKWDTFTKCFQTPKTASIETRSVERRDSIGCPFFGNPALVTLANM